MVNRIKNIYIILLLVIFSSCAYIGVPKHIKQGFTYCFNEVETNLKELINTDGYFVMSTPNSSSLALMFYEDGTFLYGFFDVDEGRRKAGSPNISLYFKEIINDTIGNTSSIFYQSFQWGCYKIFGDIIKAQYVNHPASPSPTWNAWEVWYKVIDRNTIVEIYSNPIHHMSESDWKNWEIYKKKMEKTIVPAKFISVGQKPAPNCWLKNQKWFWCDEKEWKAYRDSIK